MTQTSANTDPSFHAYLINSQTAARLLGIGARTLWDLTKRDAIPSRRIGRSVRYFTPELQAWIELGCPLDQGAAHRVRTSMQAGGAG